MRFHTAFGLLSLILLTGCAHRFQYMAYPPTDSSALSPQQLLAFAYDHYKLGDEVRALNFVYRAASVDPSDLRSPLLTGLIYDLDFDRPDLAVIEYEKVLPLRAWSDLPTRLSERLVHLRRRSEYSRISGLAKSGEGLPASTYRLAFLQFESVGPRAAQSGLSLGLTDLVMHGLKQVSEKLYVDALELHILQRAYLENTTERVNAEFAEWSGAQGVFTGTLTDLGLGRLKVTIQVLGSDGRLLHKSPAIRGHVDDLTSFYRDLMKAAVISLDLKAPTAGLHSPISSTLAMIIHAHALELLLEDQTESANLYITKALESAPASSLIARTRNWIDQDLAGRKAKNALVSTYHKIMEHSLTLAQKP